MSTPTPILPPPHILSHYAEKGGTALSLDRLSHGLINQTWLVRSDTPFILQKLSPTAFAEPEKIMHNIQVVQTHLAKQKTYGERSWQLPKLVPTINGEMCIQEESGFWRALQFIDGSCILSTEPQRQRQQVDSIGKTLGEFHALMATLSVNHLHMTLPEFHNTYGYWQALRQAAERSAQTPFIPNPLWHYLSSHASQFSCLQEAQVNGDIHLVPTHGDPKCNNFIFSPTDTAVALIDLDTLQPGLYFHDLADCIRSCCRTPQDELNLKLVAVLVRAYKTAFPSAITAKNAPLLAHAIWVVPMELSMRYLTDYLQDNIYFRVTYPQENLDKAMKYWDLAKSIEDHFPIIEKLISTSH